jgi:tetratricopeptide (TPR) repeat protein
MKNLIHEIHRRSLWQVLGIYLGASWIVLQIVDTMAGALGLPDWSASFALFLLVIGLPIVLATAFVQEGIGGRAERRETDGPLATEEDVGSDSQTDPLRVPPGPGSGRRRLLTWRNALVGGVGAFALLGVLTAAYLFMRTSGIGPAATLVAQGVFEEGARVVLADFESADAELADVVTGALRVDLLQSPTIRVLERADLSADLERMQLASDAPITSDVARELAARAGYSAVIEGEIGTAGAGYVLTARIVSGADGSSLAAFRETARGDDDLIDAIEELSRDIRDKSGESLRTVQGGPPLKGVTTGSLEALRLYTRAEAIETGGDFAGSVELYERAIELDPEFAMAYRKLGVMLNNVGIRQTDIVAAVTRAFELRDRLPELERYLAEGYYYSNVVGDNDETIRAYERAIEVDPGSDAGLNNLAVLFRVLGRKEEAEALYERALAANAPFQQGFNGLARVRFELGEHESALATLDLGEEALPGAAWMFERLKFDYALSVADYDLAADLTASFGERFRTPAAVSARAGQLYRLAAVRGRLDEAEEAIGALTAAGGAASHPVRIAGSRAGLMAARGDSAAAISVIVDAHEAIRASAPPGERLYATTLRGLYRLGAPAVADDILDEWVDQVPENELGGAGRSTRREMAARQAMARGDRDGAVGLWNAYARECPGVCLITASLGLARTHDAAGDLESAVREYERYLADPLITRSGIDAFERPPVLERLGALYEAIGDRSAAARYYGMFVDLWAVADDVLQPRVEAARTRMRALEAAE